MRQVTSKPGITFLNTGRLSVPYPRSMSSIKRDVKKKVLPRPDAEKIFVSRSSPLPVNVPLDLLERFVLACLPFPWLSSSGGDDANRVLNLASGLGI
jgi:hypothetical protein